MLITEVELIDDILDLAEYNSKRVITKNKVDEIISSLIVLKNLDSSLNFIIDDLLSALYTTIDPNIIKLNDNMKDILIEGLKRLKYIISEKVFETYSDKGFEFDLTPYNIDLLRSVVYFYYTCKGEL